MWELKLSLSLLKSLLILAWSSVVLLRSMLDQQLERR